MTILLLLVLIITEIGFAAFELSRRTTRGEWATRRLCVSGIELLTYLIMTVLPGIDFGFRFTALLAVLVIQIIISGIFWLIKRKNGKIKGRPSIVVRTLVGIVILAMAMGPAFMFKDYHGLPTTGDNEIAECSAILIDDSRVDEFENDGSNCEVGLHFFYPKNVEKMKAHSLPLVIFSHGAFGYYQSNMSTYMELASHGYVVISLDHPHHAFYTTDSEGKTIIVDSDYIQSAMDVGNGKYDSEKEFELTSEWMKLRLADMNFVIDNVKSAAASGPDSAWAFGDDENAGEVSKALAGIDTKKIGLMGHSLGGATSVTAGRRGDVSAVIDFDGTMLGEVKGVREDGENICNEDPYPTPVLDFRNQEHQEDCEEATKLGKDYVNNVIIENAVDGYSTYVKNSGHMNFTDLPLFSPFLANMLGTGDVDPKYCIEQVNSVTLNFFDCYLKGEGTFTVQESY